MRTGLFLIFSLVSVMIFGQKDLIYNGSFEIYKNCPEMHNKYRSGVTELVPGWFIINTSTPDYFNMCSQNSNVGVPDNFAGTMPPKDGAAYVGMILRADTNRYMFSKAYNEHLQTALLAPPERNQLYCLQFYYVLSSKSGIAANGLSVYLSSNKPVWKEATEHFSFTPQMQMPYDTILSEQDTWQLYSGAFRASGEERYLSVGAFLDYEDAKYITLINTATTEIHSFAYYLFDDFRLYPIDSLEQCNCNVINNQLDSFPEIEYVEDDIDPFMEDIDIGETIVLQNIYFEFDKSTLLPHSFAELDRVYNLMEAYPKMQIEIRGHTDNTGSDAYNQVLSEARAKSVLEYLYLKGISLSRMKYSGFGSSLPIADNHLPEGRKLNRRVEIKILNK
ncbi:MAG: hypothetical protein C0592_06945 [Marinilabiliales bacterium]|nr:MAG: hypothetical protein C0592_06945 [Marinilabiliales bacterium]